MDDSVLALNIGEILSFGYVYRTTKEVL